MCSSVKPFARATVGLMVDAHRRAKYRDGLHEFPDLKTPKAIRFSFTGVFATRSPVSDKLAL